MLASVPLVHHVHSPTTLDTTDRFRNWINCLAERTVLPRAKALIAVSEAVGDYVRQQGFGVFVVPNGVPPRRAVPARNPAKPDWTLGMIALFRPRKGLEVLLEALALLRGRGLPVRLRAVGSFETPGIRKPRQASGGRSGLGFGHRLDRLCPRHRRRTGPHGPFRAPQSLRRGAADGRAGGDVRRTAGRGQRRAGRARGRPRRRRGPAGRAGRIRAALAAAIGRFVSREVSWNELGSGALLRHAECFSDVRMAADVARVYDRVLSAK